MIFIFRLFEDWKKKRTMAFGYLCCCSRLYYLGKYQSLLMGKSEYHRIKALPFSHLGKVLNQRQQNLNPGEKKLLKDWVKETFNSRCLPISSAMGTLAFISVQSGNDIIICTLFAVFSSFIDILTGYLKGSKKWGPLPTVCLAIAAGCFIGLDSNLKKCYDQFISLPNNPVAEAIRLRNTQLAPRGTNNTVSSQASV